MTLRGEREAEWRTVDVFVKAARAVHDHLRQRVADAVVLIAAAPPPTVGEIVLQYPAVRDGPGNHGSVETHSSGGAKDRVLLAPAYGRRGALGVEHQFVGTIGVDIFERDSGGQRRHGPIREHVGPDGVVGGEAVGAEPVDLRQMNARGPLGEGQVLIPLVEDHPDDTRRSGRFRRQARGQGTVVNQAFLVGGDAVDGLAKRKEHEGRHQKQELVNGTQRADSAEDQGAHHQDGKKHTDHRRALFHEAEKERGPGIADHGAQ